ncbi:MAG: glycosyl hydrolase, partial [Burkholderiales bacterium]|nr:glycosyl hydrolase [Burkholderiales bacterium]
ALDEADGPHSGGCNDCRGVVTIDSATGAVTRNLEYYALAHASRFVRAGARRIESTSGVDGVATVAFRNADDGGLVLIACNAGAAERHLRIADGGQAFEHRLPPHSVATYTWPALR